MPTLQRALVPALATVFAVSAAYAEKPSPKPQEVFASYWTSEPGWDTELQLKNNLASGPLTVTPFLRVASGEEIALDPVTVPSNVSVSVWVNEQLLKHSPAVLNLPNSYGSVVFRFTSLSAMNLYATAVPFLHGQPIAFPVSAHPASQSLRGNGPGSLEGIWWQPRAGLNDLLVISNSSEKKISGTLSLFNASGNRWNEALVLAPRQTLRMATSDLLQKASLGGTYGGVSFQVSSSASAVDGVHFIYSEEAKFSASLEMVRRDPSLTLRQRAGKDAKQWTMQAPMLTLRTPDPAIGLPVGTVMQPTIFVRNTTAKYIAASITLNWRGPSGKGEAKLTELRLAPFATQQLQIGAMQKDLGIPDSAHWALVSLTTDALPDDLVAIASSRDSSGRYGTESRFTGALGDHFAGGEWQVDADHNEIAAITNTGTKPADALLTLHYDNGEKKYEMQQTIQPGDQMWVNFAQLIRNRVPDRKGNILPVGVDSATYDLRDMTPGSHSLMATGMAVDGMLGLRVHHNYPECCPSEDLGWVPDDFDLSIDDTGLGEVWAMDSCTGAYGNISGEFDDWGSDDSAIATVSNSGKVTGVAAGTTTATASGDVMVDGCIFEPVEEHAPVAVGPYQVEPINTASQGPADCSIKGQAGWVRNVTNQVQYVDGSPYAVSGLTAADQITTTTPNQLGISGAQVGSYPTTGDGSFPDTYYVCSASCPGSGKTGALQNWTVSGIPLPHVNAITYQCTSILIDGY